MKGRKAKPVEIRMIEGSFVESRHGAAHPMAEKIKDIPKKPKDLTAVGYEYFVMVCQFLIENNMMAAVDMSALIRMCQYHQIVVKAQKDTCKGIMVKVQGITGKGMIKNPAFQVLKDYSELLLKHEQLFGITPAVRARIKLGEPEKAKDPLQELMEQFKAS